MVVTQCSWIGIHGNGKCSGCTNVYITEAPVGGGGREPPGTHSECRTGATGSPNESRPRADPGPASGRVSPDPGASTPGTSGLGQSKPPVHPSDTRFTPPARQSHTCWSCSRVDQNIPDSPHLQNYSHYIWCSGVCIYTNKTQTETIPKSTGQARYEAGGLWRAPGFYS